MHTDFSIKDVGLSGFRFLRRQPLTVTAWIGAFTVAYLAGYALFAFLAQGPLSEMTSPESEGWLTRLWAFARFAPIYVAAACAYFALQAVLYAAMIRAVLRPDEERNAFLRLGRDELNQFVVMLILAILSLAAMIALAIGCAVLAGVARLVAGQAVGVLGGVAFGLAGFLAFLYAAIRLSLAYPITFDRGRIDPFGSWQVTRGHVGQLLGTFLLAGLVCIGVLVPVIILAAIGGLFVRPPEPSEAMDLLSAQSLSSAAFQMVFTVLAGVITWVPLTVAYLHLTGEEDPARSPGASPAL